MRWKHIVLLSVGIVAVVVAASSFESRSHTRKTDPEGAAEDLRLVEYAKEDPAPGIGSYARLDRRLRSVASEDSTEPRYEFGERRCHWCIQDRHRESHAQRSCTGRIYFGPKTPQPDYPNTPPSLGFPCECDCVTDTSGGR